MKTIYYGLLCEDNPHQLFIRALMSQLPAKSKDKKIKELKLSYKKDIEHGIRVFNKNEVLRRCGEAASLAFGKYNLHLLLVGVDYDEEWKLTDFEKHFREILNTIDRDFHKGTVLFLPVKCMEHWLLCLKLLKENPSLKSCKKQEGKSNKEAKREIYGRTRASKSVQEQVINRLCDDINIDWLVAQSESFKHFHDQLQMFLKSR